MSKIHDYKQGSGDVQVSNGYYAVDPAGNVVLVPPLQDLKAGFVLADENDIAFAASRKQPAEAVVVEAEPIVEEPAPLPPVEDEPVEEVVEALEVDVPLYERRDRD